MDVAENIGIVAYTDFEPKHMETLNCHIQERKYPWIHGVIFYLHVEFGSQQFDFCTYTKRNSRKFGNLIFNAIWWKFTGQMDTKNSSKPR